MALVDNDIIEMPDDPEIGAMPPYQRILSWLEPELIGLSAEQLDFDDQRPDREWMWWSIRRQVSHMAWDALVFTSRRCGHLLWPNGDVPEPIVWADHYMGRDAKFDRMLDPGRYWDVPDLLAKLEIGIGWLEQLVAEHPVETFRADVKSVWGSYFWQYVITTLPRGAGADADQPGYLRYTLEGSLWMVFYEMLSHVRTIQRLKRHLGLTPAGELPRVGYLVLPEYWGDTDANGPSMARLPSD